MPKKKDNLQKAGRKKSLGKTRGFSVDDKTFHRLKKYVAHKKIKEGDESVNNSSVVISALDGFLSEEGF